MGQGAIEDQPLFKDPFSEGLAQVSVDMSVGKVVRQINRDSSKVSVFWCDGPECKGDPVDAHASRPKNRIFEFCCFREVEQS